jgi:hypothetical protein
LPIGIELGGGDSDGRGVENEEGDDGGEGRKKKEGADDVVHGRVSVKGNGGGNGKGRDGRSEIRALSTVIAHPAKGERTGENPAERG